MQVYTVDQILGVRDRYKELPYPGFSLDEVIRRKRQQSGHKLLTKGEKAWGSKMPASAEEGIARKVQGELNKLAPEKYDSVVNNLLDENFFATEKTVDVVIKVIFKKALEEPGYSELYARLCYDMARFEVSDARHGVEAAAPSPSSLSQIVSGAAAPATPKVQRKSYFRNSIISCVQSEFVSTNSAAAKLSTLEGEELEYEEARLTRRKKANIKFVGQLYMQRVMFASTMLTIMHQILKLDQAAFTPTSIDVEVLSELLETIGKTIDSNENVVKMDTVFDRLRKLQSAKGPDGALVYPPRMGFKIMDLLELRRNKWEARVQRADSQTPTTLQEQAAKQNEKGGTAKSLLNSAKSGTPSTATPSSKKGGSSSSKGFPSTPDAPPAGPTWRNVMAPSRDGPASFRSPTVPDKGGFAGRADGGAKKDGGKPFATKVREVMTLWLNENRDEAIPEWQETLRSSDFGTQEELNQQIVFLVIHEACTVTTKNAQQSACFFLVRALALEDEDLYQGLSKVLANAIDIGLMEDVPKFNERFVRILTMMAGRSDDELYCHGATILYNTLSRLEPTEYEEDNHDALVKIWDALRVPEPTATLPIHSLSAIIAFRGRGQERFVARLVGSMVARGVIAFEILQQWCDKPETSAACGAILKELAALKVIEASA